MGDQDFSCTLAVPSAPEKAFGDISRVSKWWGSDVMGRTDRVGESFTIRFKETWVAFRVAQIDPNREIVWEVVDCHLAWLPNKTEWTGTKVVWRISAGAGETQIHFTHVGLTPAMECYKDCAVGWTENLQQSLRALVQENTGHPDVY